MLIDGGAGVNIMPFSVFSKLNRKESELMKTNMGLSGFSGELSEAKGVISMELTVGSKTLPTAFLLSMSKDGITFFWDATGFMQIVAFLLLFINA